MKKIDVDDESLVLARRGDEYFAFSPHCTHYGGPLHEGVLHGHTVICPWHHACFDIRTGIREEPPALNSLSSYPVAVVDGRVVIELEPIKLPPTSSIGADQTFVILGGGAAGQAAAEELRRLGFAGTLTILSAASIVPVDRPNLSKAYMAGNAEPDWIPLRDEDWYRKQSIDLRLETRVTDIDAIQRIITTDSGDQIVFDKLLLATGSYPRTLSNTPGVDLEGIHTLRQKADADRIIADIDEGTQVTIVGASFIGMEVAASLGQRGAQITAIEVADVPFEAVLGKDVGRYLQQLHEENGVEFRLNTSVRHFIGEDGRVAGVGLTDGSLLKTDMVVIGIGVTPATDYLSGADIAVYGADQSVLVNNDLQTSVPDIYAAGDIARYPIVGGGTQRIEHWRVAQQQGFIAARNMLDRDDDINQHVPFFWTTEWGTHLRYVGYASHWDEIIYRGDVEKGDFIAFYLSKNRLQAAAGIGRDAEMAALNVIMKHRLPLTSDDMRDPDYDLIALARSS